MTDSKAEIVKLLGDNAEVVTKNLHAMWIGYADDMTAAGIDREAVVDSILTVGVLLTIKLIGITATNERLRNIAEFNERKAQAPTEH